MSSAEDLQSLKKEELIRIVYHKNKCIGEMEDELRNLRFDLNKLMDEFNALKEINKKQEERIKDAVLLLMNTADLELPDYSEMIKYSDENDPNFKQCPPIVRGFFRIKQKLDSI